MGNYEENLIGNSIQLMEVDDEEFNLDEAAINADIIDLLETFGTDEFKEIYQNLYNEIRSLELEKKREFCNKFVNTIYNLFEFEFIPELDFDDDKFCNDFLDFVSFLQFDYIEEISLIIHGMDLQLLKKNSNLFLEKYSNEIIAKIDFLVDNNKFKELISKFFRTNNKDNIIIFLKPRLQKDKMIIILNSMKGEFENEGEEGRKESE